MSYRDEAIAKYGSAESKYMKRIWREHQRKGDFVSESRANKLTLKKAMRNTIAFNWFLGWMYTDGCLDGHNGHYLMRLGIQPGDIDVLKKMQKYFGCGTIDYRKSGAIVTWTFSNKEVFTYLESIGIVQRKSLREEYPQIEGDGFVHFVRGFFEGDGTIFVTPRDGVDQLTVSMMSKNRLIIEFMAEKLGRSVYHDLTSDIYAIRIQGTQQAIEFLQWIYKDKSSYFMNRKYNKFIEYLKYRGLL